MIEIIRESNGPVTIRISDEDIEDIKEILSSLFRETSFAQSRLRALSGRFEVLEDSIEQLMEINQQLAGALQQQEEKKTHLPARGTKYYRRLWELCSENLDSTFTSEDVPENERHILSILKNEYDVLEVARKKGRRNFYRVKPEIARKLLKDRGHWFSTQVDAEERKRFDPVVAEERERNEFILDVTEGEEGSIYEFYFPDEDAGKAFENRLLALPQ